MPRVRRCYKSSSCYEICFRARSSLPFVAYKSISFIIGAALARTQRDDKVILCHDIWNGSHAHIIIVSKDSNQLVAFYSEVQKRITDYLKRLLGLDYLQLWEGYPMVAEILDLDEAINRIAYLYANPAQDGLESSIEKFPGYSSWNAMLSCSKRFRAIHKEEYPWIRLPSIPTLPSATLSNRQDEALIRHLKKRNNTKHVLTREPNAWMKCFDIDDDDSVAEINQRVIQNLREREKISVEDRARLNKAPLGAAKLKRQAILKPHTPKKRSRKIFVLSSVNELRIAFIESYKAFCEKCRKVYQRYRQGEYSVEWPPGAFKPPVPPNLNILPLPA